MDELTKMMSNMLPFHENLCDVFYDEPNEKYITQ